MPTILFLLALPFELGTRDGLSIRGEVGEVGDDDGEERTKERDPDEAEWEEEDSRDGFRSEEVAEADYRDEFSRIESFERGLTRR